MIKPSEIESTAKDIVEFYDSSTLTHNDKLKILKMVTDHYETNFGFSSDPVDQWFMTLSKKTYERHSGDDFQHNLQNEQDT